MWTYSYLMQIYSKILIICFVIRFLYLFPKNKVDTYSESLFNRFCSGYSLIASSAFLAGEIFYAKVQRPVGRQVPLR